MPAGTDIAAGVTAIEISAGWVMVNCVVLLTDPRVAVTMTGPPAFTAEARPFVPAVLLMVASVLSEVLHVTWLVMSGVVPSVYVPWAVN
jgi:hypothetical protein